MNEPHRPDLTIDRRLALQTVAGHPVGDADPAAIAAMAERGIGASCDITLR